MPIYAWAWASVATTQAVIIGVGHIREATLKPYFRFGLTEVIAKYCCQDVVPCMCVFF